MNCSTCPFVAHCRGICPVSPHSKQEDYEEAKARGEIKVEGCDNEKPDEDFEVPF